MYDELRADHRTLLTKVDALERTGKRQEAEALLQHVSDHLPKHAATEEANDVPGCNCDEHPVFLRIAGEGLRRNPVQAALSMAKRLKRHIAREEEAWASFSGSGGRI